MRSQRNTWSASAGSGNSANARGNRSALPAPRSVVRRVPGVGVLGLPLPVCETNADGKLNQGPTGEGRPLHVLGLSRDHLQRVRAGPRAGLRRRRADGRRRPGVDRHRRGEKLRDYHGVPVLSVHAPCLIITQRVWGTDHWAKLQRSADAARRLGADVVVVHPPFRWQREYARGFVDGVRRLAETTGILFAVENMYPWRTPGGRAQGVPAQLGPHRAGLRRPDPGPLPRLHRRTSSRSTWPGPGAPGCGTST